MKITPQTVLFIVGPTAVGKSELAFQLAQKLGGEIISADSMQVYRGLDIGTGKPSRKEQKIIRHHLVDICSPSRSFSVVHFYKAALKAIFEIHARKKIPIVAGGTGLYIRALLEGLEPSPPPDPELRKKLARELNEKGLDFLVKKMAKMNPEKISQMDVKNPRRILRALEIELSKNKKTPMPRLESIDRFYFSPVVIGVTCERNKLYQKIDARVEAMFLKGWIREVRRMSKQRFSRTAKQAIGYSRILPLLRKKTLKKTDLPELLAQVKTDTRRYAKRQITWFRKEKVTFWVEAPTPGEGDRACRAVLAGLH